MKKLVLIALLATLALTGCAQRPAPTAADPTKEAVPLSFDWEKELPVPASVIDNALFDNDVCQSEPSVNDGVYAGDILADYEADTYRQCSNFHDYETDGARMDCPINAYIWTGEGAGTDVQHSLSYEDGWLLAILYGEGWEISLESLAGMGGELTEDDAINKCAATVASYGKLVGGEIVRYGDYDN